MTRPALCPPAWWAPAGSPPFPPPPSIRPTVRRLRRSPRFRVRVPITTAARIAAPQERGASEEGQLVAANEPADAGQINVDLPEDESDSRRCATRVDGGGAASGYVTEMRQPFRPLARAPLRIPYAPNACSASHRSIASLQITFPDTGTSMLDLLLLSAALGAFGLLGLVPEDAQRNRVEYAAYRSTKAS